MDGYAVRAADTRRRRRCGWPATSPPARSATRRSSPAPRCGISTGAAIPPGADAVLQSELAERRRRHASRPTRALEPGRTSASAARTCTRATCSRRAGDRLTLPRLSALASAGVGEVAVHRRAAAAPARHRLRAAAARRAARAGQDPRVQRADGARCWPSARAPRSIDHGVIADDREATRAAVEARPGGRRAGRLRRRLGRPARPRQARVRGLRRRGGLLARADQARQAAVVRPPRRARSCSACPATRCRAIVCFCVFIEPGAAPPARRARRRARGSSAAASATPAGAVGRPHDVPDLRARARRRRRARGDADRAPGLAHDRRARRERRLRRRPAPHAHLEAGAEVDVLPLRSSRARGRRRREWQPPHHECDNKWLALSRKSGIFSVCPSRRRARRRGRSERGRVARGRRDSRVGRFFIKAGGAGFDAGLERPARRVRRRQEELERGGGRRATLKIGLVTPRTGQAAGFGEVDPYILDLVEAGGEGRRQGRRRQDLQGPDRPARTASRARSARRQVAKDLINATKVDLMLASSTPEVVNPVSDACEAAGVPVHLDRAAVAGVVLRPRRQGGRQGRLQVHLPLLASASRTSRPATSRRGRRSKTNKIVGAAVSQRRRRQRDPRRRSPPLMEKDGFKVVDAGPYNDGLNDFSAQIAKFKQDKCEIFNTFPMPPDFATFWRQAAQQGYTPIMPPDRQDGPVPVAGRGARRPRRRPDRHRVLDAGRSRTAPRSLKKIEQGAGRRLRGDRQAVDADGRLDRGAVRRGMAAIQAAPNPKDKAGIADAIATLKVDTPLGQARLDAGAGQERLRDAAHQLPVAARASGKYPLDLTVDRQRRRPERAGRGEDEALSRASRAECPIRSSPRAVLRKRFGALVVLDGVALAVARRARRSASSAPTARARRRCSTSSPARSGPTPAASRFRGDDVTAAGRRRALPARHRPHPPGPAAVQRT